MANIITDVMHDLIHQGRVFSGCDVQLAKANDVVTDYLVQVTERTHIAYLVDADTAVLVEFYHNPTVSAVGTAVDLNNRNMGHPRTIGATMTVGPTVTDTGTRKCHLRSGSANASGKVGGLIRSEHEWVVPANSSVLISVISKSGASASMNVSLEAHLYEA